MVISFREPWFRWIIGLVFSLLIGHFIIKFILDRLRAYIKLSKRDLPPAERFIRRTPTFTGILERLFFTILIAFNVSGAGTAMMAWVTIKMVSDWNILVVKGDFKAVKQRRYAFTGLLGSVLSMLFALLGGLICSGLIFGDGCIKMRFH